MAAGTRPRGRGPRPKAQGPAGEQQGPRPGSLGAWEPGSLGAWEPGSLGAWEQAPGARGLGYGPIAQGPGTTGQVLRS
jgi:hypothetical protein